MRPTGRMNTLSCTGTDNLPHGRTEHAQLSSATNRNVVGGVHGQIFEHVRKEHTADFLFAHFIDARARVARAHHAG